MPATVAAGSLVVLDAVVDIDGLLVRTVIRELLPPAEAAAVDASFASAVDGAHRTLAGGRGSRAVLAWLYNRLELAGTRGRWLLDVRALQVAGYWHGIHVVVDLPTLDGWLLANPGPGGTPTSVWHRLHGYRQPFRAAVCALAGARLGTRDILSVTVGDAETDGSTVTVNRHAVPITPAARALVATRRLYRVATGATDTDPLISDLDGEPVTDKFVASVLTQARTELGVVSARRTERATADEATLLRRLGITLTTVANPVEATPAVRGDPTTTPVVLTADLPQPLLDINLMRRRRMELRRSRRDLAKALGVTGQTIARLEDGTNHGDQQLAVLVRLAETLAVDLPTLLGGRPRTSTPLVDSSAAVVVVGSALHAADTGVPAAVLARALDWTLPRLGAALDGLAATAGAVGLRLDRCDGLVALVRAVEPLTRGQHAVVLRHRVASRGIDPTAGRLVVECLRRAVPGAAATPGSGALLRGNADRVAAGVLVNADILGTNEHGDVELADQSLAALFVQARRSA